jgi:hypothetical protein
MIKMTFGLTPKNIETIENILNEESPRSEDTLKKIGKEIGWCHKTAAFYYIGYLRKKINEAENNKV